MSPARVRREAQRAEIVVGVDGSASSDAAVCWAARESMLRDLPLRLVHIVSASVIAYPLAPVPATMVGEQYQRGREVVSAAADLVHEIGKEAGASAEVVGADIYYSTTIPTLIELSKEAALVVVGSRGHGALRRGLLGSVSTGLVHHARSPVAIIHESVTPPSDAPVVVGIDGSAASELATRIAFEEAAQRGVDLVAVHATTVADAFAAPGLDSLALSQSEEQVLTEQLSGLADDYPDVTIKRVVVGDRPESQLAKEAEAAQLLVVGSHGRGGFAGMLLGSVSTTLAHTVRIPLIVARSD